MALGNAFQPQLPFQVAQPQLPMGAVQNPFYQPMYAQQGLPFAASQQGLGQQLGLPFQQLPSTTQAVQAAQQNGLQFQALRGQRLYGQNSLAGNEAGLANNGSEYAATSPAAAARLPGGNPVNVNLPPPPTAAVNPTLPPPPISTVEGAAPVVAEEAAKKGVMSRLTGGGSTAGAIAVPAAAFAANGMLDHELAPSAGKNLAQSFIGGLGAATPLAGFMPNLTAGGMTSTVAAPAAAVAGGITLGEALTQPGSEGNVADWMRKSTYQKEQHGLGPNGLFMAPTSSQVTAQEGGSFGDRLKAAVADTSHLPDIKQAFDAITGQKTDAGSSESTLDLLRKIPGLGSMFGQGEPSPEGQAAANQPVQDATTGNTNLQDRFSRLTQASEITDQEAKDLKSVYNTLRASGASDEDAWAAVQSGTNTAIQNRTQNNQNLAQIDQQQQAIKQYMQPYADRANLIGQMQQQAMSGLASQSGAEYAPIFNYMAQTTPQTAMQTSDAMMQQALMQPTMAQQRQQLAQQAQWQNMVNQYLMGQQLSGQKSDLKTGPKAAQLSQTLTNPGG